ncbi:MAG: DUF2318 domain-containing protein [Desulfovibrio sp.]|nr:DUF2318 domain-containing protein [Desulfovibrio sp.]
MRVLVTGILILLLASPIFAFPFFNSGKSVKQVTAADGVIYIDAAAVKPSLAAHFRYAAEGKKVDFFIVRDGQGAVRVALDACEVCWREGKGYVLNKGAMQCLNCGRQFALNRIGVIVGGCNPHPVKFSLNGETVSIAASELLSGSNYFPGNAR